MSFNNKIIIGLIVSIVLLSALLVVNNVFFHIEIIESFIISFISGAIVSLFVTCVQYLKEKQEFICYCNNEIINYYNFLSNLSYILNSKKISIKKKLIASKIIYNGYLANNKFKKNTMQSNFIFYDFDNIARKKIYERLLNYSNGLSLTQYFITLNINSLNDLNKICEKHLKDIDEGMSILTKVVNMDYPWNELKQYLDNDTEHVDNVLNQLND